jgi:hypothetical protein
LRRAWRVGLTVVLVVSGLWLAHAAEVPNDSAPAQTAELSHHEAEFSFVNLHLALQRASTAFVREPEVGNRVFRGELSLGGQDSQAIALLWDRESAKLYLDLNRNLDLTDDSEGVYTSSRNYGGSYQSFTNVHLPLRGPLGERPLAGDLALWDYGRQPGASFALRSFWQGRAVLSGEEWQVGLIQQSLQQPILAGSAYLLLRPWSQQSEPFTTYDGSLQAVRFAPRLFLNGHSYDVTLTNTATGDLRLEFREGQSVLGEASLAGSFIERLVLEGRESVVVLDHPDAVVRVPVGSYGAPQVRLQSGDRWARLESSSAQFSGRVNIAEDKPTVLDVGGPLTNSVTIGRRAGSLYLSYQLVGCGGRRYTLSSQDRSKPPTFTVSYEGRQIGAGQFEYG